jgi:hypothetical protein
VSGPSWPEALAPEAFYGLAGEIVSMLAPHSEADPVALLMHLLVAFGNIIGRAPHFIVGGTVHHANLYCVNVGATATRYRLKSGRPGTQETSGFLPRQRQRERQTHTSRFSAISRKKNC